MDGVGSHSNGAAINRQLRPEIVFSCFRSVASSSWYLHVRSLFSRRPGLDPDDFTPLPCRRSANGELCFAGNDPEELQSVAFAVFPRRCLEPCLDCVSA